MCALCVLHTVYGSLPAPLDISTYEPSQHKAFYEAWRAFDWEACPEVQALPQDARDFVLCCTKRDVSQRPQTGYEALQMPFLEEVLPQLIDSQTAAAEQWAQAHMELFDLLGIGQQSTRKPTPLPASDSSSDAGRPHRLNSSSSLFSTERERPQRRGLWSAVMFCAGVVAGVVVKVVV